MGPSASGSALSFAATRLGPTGEEREHYGFAQWRFDLKVTQTGISGGYEASTRPGVPRAGAAVKERSWRGRAQGGFVMLDDQASAGNGWPTFAGPNGNMSAAAGPGLVDDLGEARPVWQSEASIPVSYGNAPDSRYFWRASGATKWTTVFPRRPGNKQTHKHRGLSGVPLVVNGRAAMRGLP